MSSSSSSSTTSSSSTSDNAALVYVSNVTTDSGSYFPGDTGTVTVTLTNGGTTSIGLEDPTLISPHLDVQESDWEGMTYVGAGDTVAFTLRFTVMPPDGTYNALFTIGTEGGNAIHYPVEINVNSNSLLAAVTSQPTSFAPEAEQNVTLTLMNTRCGAINDIVITPEGTGIVANPAMDLIPSLASSSSYADTFGITSHQASTLTFNISYQDGDNTHYTDVVLPITIGQDKTAAVPVLNDVELTTTATGYDITGDITNAGISDAYGVIVNIGSPATGTGTYPVYAIGSIASDDSGTFELTFTTSDLSAVPVVITWKDSAGNDYSLTKTLNLASPAGTANATAGSGPRVTAGTGTGGNFNGGTGGMSRGGSYGGRSSSNSIFGGITSGRGGGIAAFYPLIAGAVLLVVGIILWVKRKWIMLKIKKQQ
ncbi:hypothetical protein [Methanoregula sp.]|uniref:hypothetical protein n=1 Tax=Methanoregula sp. TaxID=2052170 RepID=UPI002B8A01DB|nr:hypothetical protein [Methanoregula sp.]HVP97036.1 hypothetical protein [Methanoregula sp.]